MEEDNEAPQPVEQRVPGSQNSYGGSGQPQYQPVPPYAASFPMTEIPNEMMGRVILGFILILIGWIMSSVYLSALDGDATTVVQMIGLVFRSIGLVIVVIAMLQGALLQSWYSERTRMGILIAAGLIVIGV